MQDIISVRQLTKRYGTLTAEDQRMARGSPAQAVQIFAAHPGCFQCRPADGAILFHDYPLGASLLHGFQNGWKILHTMTERPEFESFPAGSGRRGNPGRNCRRVNG